MSIGEGTSVLKLLRKLERYAARFFCAILSTCLNGDIYAATRLQTVRVPDIVPHLHKLRAWLLGVT